MDIIQIIALAVLQGLTEFLPVSSSAHLILVPIILGWQDQGLAFDIAVHVGTLSAVVFYFRHELKEMAVDWFYSISKNHHTQNSMLAWGVLIGTIPLGLFGLAVKDIVETQLRHPLVIATTTVVFGVLLWWAFAKSKQVRDEYTLGIKDILIIGCAQALALIPGTSRSGITITAGMMVGLTGQAAARFSFLLSIPAIVLPGSLKVLELIGEGNNVDWSAIFYGTVLSAISAYLCIHAFLKLLQKIGMTPFVIYRLILGLILFIMFFPTTT